MCDIAHSCSSLFASCGSFRSNLGANNLTGTIPSGLGGVTALSYLCVPATRSFPNLLTFASLAPVTWATTSSRASSRTSAKSATSFTCACMPFRIGGLAACVPPKSLSHDLLARSDLGTNDLGGTLPDMFDELYDLQYMCVRAL